MSDTKQHSSVASPADISIVGLNKDKTRKTEGSDTTVQLKTLEVKMIQLPGARWQFYHDKLNQWQWRKFVVNKVVGVSSDSFYSRQACVNDARKRGYIGPMVFSKKSRANTLA